MASVVVQVDTFDDEHRLPPELRESLSMHTLPRRPGQDPEKWVHAFQANSARWEPDGPLMDEDLKRELCKCGDFVQITYNNFLPSETAVNAFQKAANVQNITVHGLENKSIGGYKYGPGELMHAPAGRGAAELNVAASSLARDYVIGIADEDGNVYNDPTFYLQATSGFYKGEFAGAFVNVQSTNWIGFVGIGPVSKEVGPVWKATEPGSLDIIVAFRGTQEATEWLSNVSASMATWQGACPRHKKEKVGSFFFGSIFAKDHPGRTTAAAGPGTAAITKGAHYQHHSLLYHARVADGFDAMYRHFTKTPGSTLSMQGQVHVAVRKLLWHYKELVGSITVTGHSLGGAIAEICAFDLVASGCHHLEDKVNNPYVPVTAITLETPRTGNWAFADMFKVANGPRHFRVCNVPDIVPKVPYVAWGEGGLFTLAFQLFYMLPLYVWELWGQNAGLDRPRPPKGKPERRAAFYHSGTPYKVVSNWNSNSQSGWWRKVLQLPLFPNPKNFFADIMGWHNPAGIMHAIAPDRQGPTGPHSYQ